MTDYLKLSIYHRVLGLRTRVSFVLPHILYARASDAEQQDQYMYKRLVPAAWD